MAFDTISVSNTLYAYHIRAKHDDDDDCLFIKMEQNSQSMRWKLVKVFLKNDKTVLSFVLRDEDYS